MKKTIMALAAFMLVMGMTQCKKEQQNDIIPDEGETVYITMKVADDGGKHIVYPGTGAVVFGDGDVIYVGNNGHYVGTLTYANGAFSGSITSPSTSDYLHFYFTGGKTPATNPTTSTTSFTVNIGDQSSKLPVLSYGHSTTKYIDGNTAYTCLLENKCGLVKFVSYEALSTPIRISGRKIYANIDFENPGITPTGDNTFNVTLYSVSDTEKWAILLPQDAVDYSNAEVIYDEINGVLQFEVQSRHMSVPAVTSNMYNSIGVPLPALGRFTINSNGSQVYFSRGNLQYTTSSYKWRFADYQWDYIGDDNSHISSSYTGWIDLFGWGTSGWNSGAVCYQPYSNNGNNDFYNVGARYNVNLTGDYANADWGVYNKISNGGNTAGLWRTLTGDEWNYVFSNRSTNSGILYAKANVNSINGVILLPDSWSEDYYALNSTNTATAGYSSNIITASQWITLEQYGAVFLPAAGVRVPNHGSNAPSGVGTKGYYSSASFYGVNSFNYNKAVFFSNTELAGDAYTQRSNGASVRLVQDVQ